MSSRPSRCLVRGAINIDELFHVDDAVRPGETIFSTELERRVGGKGANQAVAVARAGGSVALVGAVGEDGGWVIDQLRGYGVDVSAVHEAEVRQEGGVLHKGANHTQTPPSSHFSSKSSEPLTSTITHILLQNEIPSQTTISHLTHFHHQSATTIFNPSPMPSREELFHFPWKHLDWLLVNEGEAEALLKSLRYRHKHGNRASDHIAHSKGDTYSTIKRLHVHRHFSERTNIVCTLGALGVIVLIHDQQECLYLEAAELKGAVGGGEDVIRDTTSAEDCFAGYFVRGLMQMHEQGVSPIGLREAGDLMRVCLTAAAMCVERRSNGAMESIPSSEKVQERLAQMP
ncbi:Ribokinase-like protein [Stereum hirsutum FP-91666 SS1]|uniref:Ribokinase-like protein n=1 Tax=Stereum hirsutum (strain FP-91666) TaxID=721885 RepID=UPI000440E6DC|nr:Ribokinase-like protein [Stereum hirsutum FP-91666 SS1]EIM87248.1 Ribokinase-like protein [Stereum hirsutum FP-91666 SS1]